MVRGTLGLRFGSHAYDNNGNTQTKVVGTNTTTYAWDYENRVSSVTLPAGGGTVSFAYDPFGRRIKKVTSSTTSIFAYDGDDLIEETNSSGAAVARYSQTQNVDEPLAMLRSSATSYFHADGLGSITSLSNSAGSLAQTYTFDSFGKQTASSGSLTNPLQYSAREFDPETGLYYYRARYYDPTIGRFISMDPIGFEGGNNHYAFVKNNPLLLRDPKGTCPPGDPPCKVTIFRPGMNGLTFYNGCGDEGMKLFWAADCKGDRKCCLNTLNDKQNYQDPCEKYGGKYFIWDKAQLVIGWCCKKN